MGPFLKVCRRNKIPLLDFEVLALRSGVLFRDVSIAGRVYSPLRSRRSRLTIPHGHFKRALDADLIFHV
jgi:hypothetical protein